MKAWVAAILLTGSVALASASASAQVFPTCPPGYAFAPAYGSCYPYASDPSYFDQEYYDQGYPFYPGFYSPFLFSGGFGRFHHGFGHGFAGHGFAGGGHFGGRR